MVCGEEERERNATPSPPSKFETNFTELNGENWGKNKKALQEFSKKSTVFKKKEEEEGRNSMIQIKRKSESPRAEGVALQSRGGAVEEE